MSTSDFSIPIPLYCPRIYKSESIKNLSLKEQAEIYISKNIGGVVHSNEEIEKLGVEVIED